MEEINLANLKDLKVYVLIVKAMGKKIKNIVQCVMEKE
jgi:hypothetical protein